VRIAKGLTFRSAWGFDRVTADKTEYSPVYNYGTFNKSVSELRLEDISKFYWVWDNILNYRLRFLNDHSIELTAGHSAEKDKGKNTTIRASNIPAERNLWYITQGDPVITYDPLRTGAYGYQRKSLFGRANYSFKDKYNLSGVIRRDGSSAFPEDNKWGTFYSVAGSWILSEESFMERFSVVDFLKIRGGFARLGNDAISRAVSNELSKLSSITNTSPYSTPAALLQAITINRINDPDATWESTNSMDLGIEFGVLNRRLTGEVSYYNKSTDAYIRVPTPSFADPDGFLGQAAEINNRGFEFLLAWNQQISDDVDFRISANATINKNNVENVKGGIDLKEGGLGNGQVTTSTVVGQPIASFWVYEVAGIFQSQAEIDATPHVTGTLPGDFRYTDFNKDGFIDERDRIFVGAYQPKFFYGLSGTLNWKRLDFSIDCYGNAGNKVYNGKKAVRFGNENIEVSRGDRWSPSNTNTDEYRASNQIPVPSTYFVESGSFFRINNLTIGYTLPGSVSDRAFMSRARVFVSAQNPLISKKFSGFSPELQGSNALNSGIELSVYPITATYMIGVNVNFK
jgi:TonB-dependent starch-binding outer membrane protein SusC